MEESGSFYALVSWIVSATPLLLFTSGNVMKVLEIDPKNT